MFFQRDGRSGVTGSVDRDADVPQLMPPVQPFDKVVDVPPSVSGTTATSTDDGPVLRGLPQSTDDDDEGLDRRR